MPDVTVNGLRFHTQTLGEATDPPVVMVHGMITGSAASWYFGLAPVVARRHRVFVYDQRGHGRSQRPASGYSLTQLADDLDGLTVDLGPAAVVGHSYGGVVALRHALDHPERVTSLVLVDSFVPTGDTADDATADGGLTSDGIDAPPEWGPDATEGPADSEGVPIEVAGAPDGSPTRRRRRRPTEVALRDTTLFADLRSDSRLDAAALAALRIPVLCAVGSDSPFRGEVEELADLLPGHCCQVHVLAGGHALHLDAPDQLAELVTDFLDRPRLPPVPARG
jgi:pimeloyl-ACP methyl ester carboxylesterase